MNIQIHLRKWIVVHKEVKKINDRFYLNHILKFAEVFKAIL